MSRPPNYSRPIAPPNHRHITVHSDSSTSILSFHFAPEALFTQLPIRHPRSPHRAAQNIPQLAAVSDANLTAPLQPRTRTISTGTTVSEPPRGRSFNASQYLPSRSKSLPREERASSPSESSSNPHTPVATATRSHHARDSFITQASGSTLYPADSSTSGVETPPSPVSPVLQDDVSDDDGPGIPNGVDADDVSYRLRLLVRNNYFLPPAHSKPVPYQPPPLPEAAPPTKGSSLLGLFRSNKPKSAPRSPELQPLPAASPSQSRGHPAPVSTPANLQYERPPRVAVLRERVGDLTLAAMQSERDMKMRDEERRRAEGSRHSDQGRKALQMDDIDPTDVVDMDPTHQGSTQTPGVSNDEPLTPRSPEQIEEDTWRKAILLQAVDMSFSSSSNVNLSGLSATPDTSAVETSTHEPQLAPTRVVVAQPIRENLPRLSSLSDGARPKRLVSDQGPRRPAVIHRNTEPAADTRTSTYTPRRAETPAELTRPLAPPPPRRLPMGSVDDQQIALLHRTVRRVTSSPRLPSHSPEHYEVRDRHGMLTPPLRSPTLVVQDPEGVMTIPSRGTVDSFTSGSQYSEDEDFQTNRPSFTGSSPSYRPSLSESQASHFSTSFGPRKSFSVRSSTSTTHLTPMLEQIPPRTARSPSPSLATLREAPSPASPLFFDQVEAQSFAKNDYTDTEDEHTTVIYVDPQTKAISNSAISGASTPTAVQFSATQNPYLSTLPLDPRRAITNTPPTSQPVGFLKQLKGSSTSKSKRIPESTFELLLAKGHDDQRLSEGSSRGGNDSVQSWRDNQSGQDESLRRLDGLLVQHIEAERDHLRRIAMNTAVHLQQTR